MIQPSSRQATLVISCTPLSPHSLGCLRNLRKIDQPALSSLALSIALRIFRCPLAEKPAAARTEDVSDLTSPGAFQYDTSKVNIGISPCDLSVTPFFDSRLNFLFRLGTALGLTLKTQRAPMIPSTRRTETPAGYISIGASSTDDPRLLCRSMIAVSNFCRRNFGTFSQASPAPVCRSRS